MFDIDLIWDALLQKQVGELNRKTIETGQAATDAGARIRALEQRYAQLRLVSMAMWNILKERMQVTDAELIQHVEALRGGSSEQLPPGLVECPKCKRRIPARSQTCLYCGAQTSSAGSFQAT